MKEINKRIIRDCIDVGFDVGHIRQTKVTQKDDNDIEYAKTISYMENSIKVDKSLILLVHDKSVQVARVIDYIVRYLSYNDTNIVLSPSHIARQYNDDRSNISKAINELVKLNIIRKISDYNPNDVLPKNSYAVNFNYICNGNIQEIKKEILKQRNKNN